MIATPRRCYCYQQLLLPLLLLLLHLLLLLLLLPAPAAIAAATSTASIPATTNNEKVSLITTHDVTLPTKPFVLNPNEQICVHLRLNSLVFQLRVSEHLAGKVSYTTCISTLELSHKWPLAATQKHARLKAINHFPLKIKTLHPLIVDNPYMV